MKSIPRNITAIKLSGIFIFFIFIFLNSEVCARTSEFEPDSLSENIMKKHMEIPQDKFIPSPISGRQTSPAYKTSRAGFFATQVNLSESGENIIGDAANEPSIAVDPTNPRNMVIGWRYFSNISSNFRQAGYGYTKDGGKSWTFPGVIEPGIFRSDPVLDYDMEGNIYYNSLTVNNNDFSCQLFKTTDGGVSWDNGFEAYGGDKVWMNIDKSNTSGRGSNYSFWSAGLGVCNGAFTRSPDNENFENCTYVTNDPHWGTITTNSAGELFIGGAVYNGFAVAKSSNASNFSENISWDFSKQVDLDGEISFGGGPNPGGLLGQTWIAIDTSDGDFKDNIYLLCSVERYSNNDPLDVMFARSADGGLTWSEPRRVNDDPSNTAYQWFGTMSVAPNGRIDVIWLDTRNSAGYDSQLYYSYSIDAGVTWSANQALSDPFNPHLGWPNQNKMGDYFDMISFEGGAHIAWAATFNGEQDVYYGRISLLGIINETPERANIPAKFSLYQNYPNPFNPETIIRFEIPEESSVTLKIYDLLGRTVRSFEFQDQNAGEHEIVWDGKNDNGAEAVSGVYFYQLRAGEFSQTMKMALSR